METIKEIAKDFIKSFIRNFLPIALLMSIGAVVGIAISKSEKPKGKTKQYPIEVRTKWSALGYQGGSTMECDSVIGDAIWKDGNKLISKNIVEVKFK
jgi:hypothetical protein